MAATKIGRLSFSAQIQAAGVQDAAPGREAVAFAAHPRPAAALPRLRRRWPGREDHQDLRQRTRSQFPLPGNGR